MLENVIKQIKLRWMHEKKLGNIIIFFVFLFFEVGNLVNDLMDKNSLVVCTFGNALMLYVAYIFAAITYESTRIMAEDKIRMYPGTILTRFLGLVCYCVLEIVTIMVSSALVLSIMQILLDTIGVSKGRVLLVNGGLLELWKTTGITVVALIAIYMVLLFFIVLSKRISGILVWGMVLFALTLCGRNEVNLLKILILGDTPLYTLLKCGSLAVVFLALSLLGILGKKCWMEEHRDKNNYYNYAAVLIVFIGIILCPMVLFSRTRDDDFIDDRDIEQCAKAKQIVYDDQIVKIDDINEMINQPGVPQNYFYEFVSMEDAKESGLVDEKFEIPQGNICIRTVIEGITYGDKSIAEEYLKNYFSKEKIKYEYPSVFYDGFFCMISNPQENGKGWYDIKQNSGRWEECKVSECMCHYFIYNKDDSSSIDLIGLGYCEEGDAFAWCNHETEWDEEDDENLHESGVDEDGNRFVTIKEEE